MPKKAQNWYGVSKTINNLIDRARGLNLPRLEAVLTGMMLDIQGDKKRLDDLGAISEATLTRWPHEPDVQFTVRGACGRIYAYQKRPDLALPLLENALLQPHSRNDHERLRL